MALGACDGCLIVVVYRLLPVAGRAAHGNRRGGVAHDVHRSRARCLMRRLMRRVTPCMSPSLGRTPFAASAPVCGVRGNAAWISPRIPARTRADAAFAAHASPAAQRPCGACRPHARRRRCMHACMHHPWIATHGRVLLWGAPARARRGAVAETAMLRACDATRTCNPHGRGLIVIQRPERTIPSLMHALRRSCCAWTRGRHHQNECDARSPNTKFGASGVSPAASWPLSVQPDGSA
jgi:hypothetical protein